MSFDYIQYQRTTASWCPSTPQSIGHAGKSSVSLQGVPWITAVGYCGPKGCTRDTSLTIFRSFGSRTTADSCRGDTVTTFLLTICNASMSNSNQAKGRKVYTCAIMYWHAQYTQIQALCMRMLVSACTYQL